MDVDFSVVNFDFCFLWNVVFDNMNLVYMDLRFCDLEMEQLNFCNLENVQLLQEDKQLYVCFFNDFEDYSQWLGFSGFCGCWLKIVKFIFDRILLNGGILFVGKLRLFFFCGVNLFQVQFVMLEFKDCLFLKVIFEWCDMKGVNFENGNFRGVWVIDCDCGEIVIEFEF